MDKSYLILNKNGLYCSVLFMNKYNFKFQDYATTLEVFNADAVFIACEQKSNSNFHLSLSIFSAYSLSSRILLMNASLNSLLQVLCSLTSSGSIPIGVNSFSAFRMSFHHGHIHTVTSR